MTTRTPMTRLCAAAATSALIGLALPIAPALAHHSFAMFDFSRTLTIHGVVKEFQWTNPHVILWVETEARAGEAPVMWSAELTSPGNLTRTGWTKRSLQPGDKVDVDISPLRDGQHGGGFRRVTVLATGQVLTSDLRTQGKPNLQ